MPELDEDFDGFIIVDVSDDVIEKGIEYEVYDPLLSDTFEAPEWVDDDDSNDLYSDLDDWDSTIRWDDNE